MPKKAENTFETGNGPELDTSPELDPDTVSSFLVIMDVLRWMTELERNDIIIELSLLSSHVVLSTKGHLEAANHFMAHVGQRYNSRLVYDLLYQEISEFYIDAKEDILVSASEP